MNITVPTGTKSEDQLPVLVFIHGGGFAIGGNWWPQYDFARLVELSVEAGKPFIGININYRVGALGFLTSPELRAAGYKANNGLRDQRTALRWIRENIGGFGGDADNITAMGQSAGSGKAKPLAVGCPSWVLANSSFATSLDRVVASIRRETCQAADLPWGKPTSHGISAAQ